MALKPMGSFQPFNPKAFAGSPGPAAKSPLSASLGTQSLQDTAAPAGLPPAPYAQIKPLVKRSNLAKPGPLPAPTAPAPRTVTPSPTNPVHMDQIISGIQQPGQMGQSANTKQALDVAGMDQNSWQKLLNSFGVFS